MAFDTIYGDPTEGLDVVAQDFEPNDIVRFLERYETENEIHCCLGHCGQKHKIGYKVLLRNGLMSVVGHVCARRQMGDERFTRMEGQLQADQRQVKIIEAFNNPNFHPAIVLEAVTAWAPAVKQVLSAQETFARCHGLVWTYLRAVARDSGILTACRFQNGTLEYGAIDESGWFRRHPGGPKPPRNLDNILRGKEFILGHELNQKYLRGCRLVKQLVGDLESSDQLLPKRLNEMHVEAGQALEDLSAVASFVNAYCDFREGNSLKAVARWISKIDEGFLEGQRTDSGLRVVIYNYDDRPVSDMTVELPKVEQVQPDVLRHIQVRPHA